jgi:hypothetical protein
MLRQETGVPQQAEGGIGAVIVMSYAVVDDAGTAMPTAVETFAGAQVQRRQNRFDQSNCSGSTGRCRCASGEGPVAAWGTSGRLDLSPLSYQLTEVLI